MQQDKITVTITKGNETKSFEAEALIISITNNGGSKSLTYGEMNARDAAVLVYGFYQQCDFLVKQFGDLPLAVAAEMKKEEKK